MTRSGLPEQKVLATVVGLLEVGSIELTDRRLARIVKQCRDLPGYELFQYTAETGALCAVDSANVNQYIREIRARFHR